MRFGPAEYAELLGFYLGDGHVVRAGRTHRLRLSLDARHGEVVAVARGLLARVFPRNPVSVAHLDGGATAVLSVYSRHLPCLLPQHGVGKKHDRPIVLEPWQEELVAQAQWSLLRGLLWSDGCFFINRTGPYSYLSASFSNRSADIVALFCRTCDQVGVRYTTTGCSVRICRRSSVADLAAFVGTKR
jgi:hypothetical protein